MCLKHKRLLPWSVRILFLILCCFAVMINNDHTVQAKTNTYYLDFAQKLSELGVFKGTENGFELDRQPTRLEGLVMLIRLLGKEEAANQLANQPSVFRDVPDWGIGYVNYAYQNQLTNGVGNQLFGSHDKMDGNSYVSFLLRSIGYDDSPSVNDFQWSKAIDFGKKIQLLDEELYFKMVSDTFIRDYVAKSSFNTLNHRIKGSDNTLLQKLVNAKVFSAAQADQLNRVVKVNPGESQNQSQKELTSVQIARLADAVVMLDVTGYDGSKWSGSGFYVSSDGNITTNYHVIEGAKSITVTEQNGYTYSSNIIILGFDKKLDIAAININRTVSSYFSLGPTEDVQVGEKIYTIGSPYGYTNTVSDGLVSSIRTGLIQISAPISPGNSGGVLINRFGKAIGITSSGLPDGENIGFVIPIQQYLDMPKTMRISLTGYFQPTVSTKISFEAFEQYLSKEFGSLTISKNTVFLKDIIISGDNYDSPSIYLFYYLDNTNIEDFKAWTANQQNREKIAYFMAQAASKLGNYYGKNVYMDITYVGYYLRYPSEFAKNAIYDNTIDFLENLNEWSVYYPYVNIYLDVKLNKYDTTWAY